MDIREVVAANVRRLRGELRLTQEEVAGRADCSVVYLSGVENAKRSVTVDVLVDLAEALNATPADLVTPSGPLGRTGKLLGGRALRPRHTRRPKSV